MAGSSSDKKAGICPLKMGKSLPGPDFNYQYYRVQAVDSIQAAQVNQTVEELVPNRDGDGLRRSKLDILAEDIKVSARK